jgi:AraC family transcriptional regulator, regulatory protein of adaptative response / DNA-3-methyladenine glycosylase II
MIPDADTCYRAMEGKDPRFDGWFFVAVRSTGIYCRPSCPSRTPLRRNVGFHSTAASAQRAGYRACKRCRPDASPGSPEWNVRGDLAGRALRLIADGIVDREGVPGLARRVGYSERQLHRVLVTEVGAGPIALARAQRAQTARILLETTDLPTADVAFAAGFASVRQFNDTVRDVFATTPTGLRSARRRDPAIDAHPGVVQLRLPFRRPLDLASMLDYLAARAIPGVESVHGDTYRRTLALPNGAARAEIRPGGDSYLLCRLELAHQRDLVAAVARLRRLLDLDADPSAVDAALGARPELATLVTKRPGLRSPGTVDGFELAVRAVVSQQISVAGAGQVLARLVGQAGPAVFPDEPSRLFPTAAQLAAQDRSEMPMPKARAATLHALAEATGGGAMALDPGADRAVARAALGEVPGIGPWTADYVVMRALGDPDILLATDLGVRRAARSLDLDLNGGRPDWAPWRSYATHHLWAALP